jgi:hypothetical protein
LWSRFRPRRGLPQLPRSRSLRRFRPVACQAPIGFGSRMPAAPRPTPASPLLAATGSARHSCVVLYTWRRLNGCAALGRHTAGPALCSAREHGPFAYQRHLPARRNPQTPHAVVHQTLGGLRPVGPGRRGLCVLEHGQGAGPDAGAAGHGAANQSRQRSAGRPPAPQRADARARHPDPDPGHALTPR